MAAYEELTTLDVLRWLRQKSRTTSPTAGHNDPSWSAGNEGSWSDAILVDYMNESIRHVATLLMETGHHEYFRKVRVNLTPAAGLLVVLEDDLVNFDFGVFRLGWVQWSGQSAPNYVGPIRERTDSRMIQGQQVKALQPDLESQGGANFAHPEVEFSAAFEEDPISKKMALTLRFRNYPVGDAPTVDYSHYSFPSQLDRTLASPATEQVGLPPMVWNVFKLYTLMTMFEDEDNDRMTHYAARYQEAAGILRNAAVMNYDKPAGAIEASLIRAERMSGRMG